MDAVVLAEMSRAWEESRAEDSSDRHEEGGYIVLNADWSYGVERWTRGEKSQIVPPTLDLDNCYNAKTVVAVFHTHPNPPIDEAGQEWEQGPSESDRRWHGRRKLRGFVISQSLVYEINPNATISVLGKRNEVLAP
ncbi:MAG TPA: hypothetical protein VFE47_14905 [Tepidisphaeraceae bacterium]|jgi:hypothetical protein|nr:hypothetical protein [Tepidisphaeraceae bacterium]